MKRLNVLIVAHEFSPEQGSECSEGWNLVTRLAQYHDVTVLHASGSQFRHNSYSEAIDRYHKSNNPIPGLTLINIDQPKITKFISRFNANFLKIGSIGLPVLYFSAYKYWQKAVYSEAKRLTKEKEFHILHQLTQITFREPGYLWKLGIPFVWGPTGGTSTIPKGFLSMLSWKSKVFEKIRSFSNFYQFRFVPRIIQANKQARLIYAFTKEDGILFQKRAKGEIKLMLDAGTTLTKVKKEVSKEENSSVLTAIWCGQLIERKAASILVHAIAAGQFQANQIKFLIIGDGPLRDSLIQLASELHINNIEWIKNVSHDSVFELMRAADIFIHTSYREATSNVIPEALSMGLPVICHDANGMSIAINDSCGIKIPLVSFDESVAGFQKAIHQFLSDPVHLGQLKKGAIARTEEISWDAMAATIAKDYHKIYNKNANTINK
jgi:glycosyltransferase involved in cell wall biosynthesis